MQAVGSIKNNGMQKDRSEIMDHVVYLDAQAKELDLLLSAKKTMIIRGATGRKLPYGRVNQNDVLYFINNNAEGLVRASAKVKSVINSEKLTKEESAGVIDRYQDKLQLTKKQYDRWAGKSYLVLDFATQQAVGLQKTVS
jgi:hypothetical protein